MAFFNYVAIDASGQKIKGCLEAKDRATAISSLRKSQLIIISIEEGKEDSSLFQKKGKVKLEELVIFSRQLSALVKAGIPLVRSLNILFAQIENRVLKEIISSVIIKIESGLSLSDALAIYPWVFSPFYINMIKAGEFSGALDVILERLAAYLENINNLNRKVKSAMIYPIIVVFIAFMITAAMFIFVIPRFKTIFDSLNTELPALTQLLIGVSEVIQKYIIAVIVIAVVLIFILKRMMRTTKFKFVQDRFKLEKIPAISKLIRKVIIARFSRTLATLLKSGVSILSAFDIASKTSGNLVVESILEKVNVKVSKGERIADALTESKIFPPLVVNLIAVGEEIGDLGSMLEKIADFYEEEVNNAVSGLTSLIEPFIIVFLGVVIGGIVLAMFLPILQLTKAIGR